MFYNKIKKARVILTLTMSVSLLMALNWQIVTSGDGTAFCAETSPNHHYAVIYTQNQVYWLDSTGIFTQNNPPSFKQTKRKIPVKSGSNTDGFSACDIDNFGRTYLISNYLSISQREVYRTTYPGGNWENLHWPYATHPDAVAAIDSGCVVVAESTGGPIYVAKWAGNWGAYYRIAPDGWWCSGTESYGNVVIAGILNGWVAESEDGGSYWYRYILDQYGEATDIEFSQNSHWWMNSSSGLWHSGYLSPNTSTDWDLVQDVSSNAGGLTLNGDTIILVSDSHELLWRYGGGTSFQPLGGPATSLNYKDLVLLHGILYLLAADDGHWEIWKANIYAPTDLVLSYVDLKTPPPYSREGTIDLEIKIRNLSDDTLSNIPVAIGMTQGPTLEPFYAETLNVNTILPDSAVIFTTSVGLSSVPYGSEGLFLIYSKILLVDSDTTNNDYWFSLGLTSCENNTGDSGRSIYISNRHHSKGAITLYKGWVYLIGGVKATSTVPSMSSDVTKVNPQNPDNYTFAASLPVPLAELCSAVGMGKIWIFGGTMSVKSSSLSRKIYSYSPTQGWKEEGTLPDGVGFADFDCARIGEKIYIYGGYSTDSTKNAIHDEMLVFNMANKNIEVLSQTGCTPRSGHHVLNLWGYNDRLLLVGGAATTFGGQPVPNDTVEVFLCSTLSCEDKQPGLFNSQGGYLFDLAAGVLPDNRLFLIKYCDMGAPYHSLFSVLQYPDLMNSPIEFNEWTMGNSIDAYWTSTVLGREFWIVQMYGENASSDTGTIIYILTPSYEQNVNESKVLPKPPIKIINSDRSIQYVGNGYIEVYIYDPTGREIKYASGENRVKVNLPKPGLYFTLVYLKNVQGHVLSSNIKLIVLK